MFYTFALGRRSSSSRLRSKSCFLFLSLSSTTNGFESLYKVFHIRLHIIILLKRSSFRHSLTAQIISANDRMLGSRSPTEEDRKRTRFGFKLADYITEQKYEIKKQPNSKNKKQSRKVYRFIKNTEVIKNCKL